MPDKKIALQLRLDEATHQKLKNISNAELRSLNAQIEYFILKGVRDYENKHPNFNQKDWLESYFHIT